MLLPPKNESYCATVVALEHFVDLPNCDNVKQAIIFNSAVIVGKGEKAGALGLFFPVETALSVEFMSRNNLLRDPVYNADPTKKGFFELNGRVKCVKFRGHASSGFWIPMSSLSYLGPVDLPLGSNFDTLEIEVKGTKLECAQYCTCGTASTTLNENTKRVTYAEPATKRGLPQTIQNTLKQNESGANAGLDPMREGYGINGTINRESKRFTLTPKSAQLLDSTELTLNSVDTESQSSSMTSRSKSNVGFVLSASNIKKNLLSIMTTLQGKSEDSCAMAATSTSESGSNQNALGAHSLTCAIRRSNKNSDGTYTVLVAHPICHKYVSRRNPGKLNRQQVAGLKLIDRLVPGQFAFHPDTQKLARYVDTIHPNDIITITDKWHGTSAVFGRLLAKRKLSLFQRLLKRLNVPIIETEYEEVWASRKVLKGVSEPKDDVNHFYDCDIWKYTFDLVKDKIPCGYTLYGEIVGYTPTGGALQAWGDKVWAYGCVPRQSKFYVYRVTFTGPDSPAVDLDQNQMRVFCQARGLNMLPLLFHGPAEIVASLDDVVPLPFAERFMRAVTRLVEGRSCRYNPGLPAEGVVIRVDDGSTPIRAYKCKSFDFLEGETKALDDAKSVDIEETDAAEAASEGQNEE